MTLEEREIRRSIVSIRPSHGRCVLLLGWKFSQFKEPESAFSLRIRLRYRSFRHSVSAEFAAFPGSVENALPRKLEHDFCFNFFIKWLQQFIIHIFILMLSIYSSRFGTIDICVLCNTIFIMRKFKTDIFFFLCVLSWERLFRRFILASQILAHTIQFYVQLYIPTILVLLAYPRVFL